jgi:hypothetical protein
MPDESRTWAARLRELAAECDGYAEQTGLSIDDVARNLREIADEIASPVLSDKARTRAEAVLRLIDLPWPVSSEERDEWRAVQGRAKAEFDALLALVDDQAAANEAQCRRNIEWAKKAGREKVRADAAKQRVSDLEADRDKLGESMRVLAQDAMRMHEKDVARLSTLTETLEQLEYQLGHVGDAEFALAIVREVRVFSACSDGRPDPTPPTPEEHKPGDEPSSSVAEVGEPWTITEPDDPEHAAFVRKVAEEHGFPIPGLEADDPGEGRMSTALPAVPSEPGTTR